MGASMELGLELRYSVSRPHVSASESSLIIIARPFAERDEYGVEGEVLHWAWVHEDPTLKGAPVDAASRFRETVWSKRKQ